MSHSLQLEIERNSGVPLNDPLAKRHRVACFSYELGQQFAADARSLFESEHMSPASPALVDFENDIMCFHIKTSTSMGKQRQIEGLILRSKAALDSPLPTPLKIHHSIYDAVDSLQKHRPLPLNATHLSVAVRNITLGRPFSGVSYDLKEKVGALLRYGFKDQDDFFWTSQRTLALLTVGRELAALPEEERADHDRIKQWSNLRQALEMKLREMGFLNLKDPCGFAGMKVTYYDVRHSLPKLVAYFIVS